jgi:hypothetical protein
MERRANERYRVWFPMSVVRDGGDEGTAITYDVSASGLSMACPGSLGVGEHVELRFRVSDDTDERAIGARVLRVEENGGEPGPWRFRMALRFDEPQPDLEGVLEACSAEGS